MKTTFENQHDKAKWFVVDAKDKILGRLATRIATLLRGKHKPTYTPFMDSGDFVVVVNAEKIAVTGKKLTDKIYYHHSMYPNGLKAEALGKRLQRKPEDVIMHAVWGMLPKGSLGRDMLKKLKVYKGENHPHEAQRPEKLAI
ncbi:MAG: 50S ribosomal protein L13 [Deltaproteobacteria bacterium GWC2_42_51]|nr:MAG: 50S ribosomal protein L13 [Deltaproteobacteria bacterium GWC2_42_51]OGP43610.1 MAG: 50S ribosomal protein L13 [Deltaproteobacteria bacterium GWD2_42_10]OGP46559.1 MAG: 50S ribosomal protein L13 [Deltaproteobacteria bacterium GWF2_42_12]OGQ26779.1 MAG: 50S ribosomal protein L13 [Deltaproteobacteria bacterium RIFCSPHIGHO2_02_FULL_42_44]OGQ37984.1 MAG: 50S ribosomal protein L13 [Deltaproteobacteria bacterium RIFCSPLOWO2_02_FULL_42_39]OGQ67401.1 MAG: 50S ribosomal protein L13 [Deltaproteob